ncbi:unnamed protein product, partial [Ectocarpus sp. 12 AP-2014]
FLNHCSSFFFYRRVHATLLQVTQGFMPKLALSLHHRGQTDTEKTIISQQTTWSENYEVSEKDTKPSRAPSLKNLDNLSTGLEITSLPSASRVNIPTAMQQTGDPRPLSRKNITFDEAISRRQQIGRSTDVPPLSIASRTESEGQDPLQHYPSLHCPSNKNTDKSSLLRFKEATGTNSTLHQARRFGTAPFHKLCPQFQGRSPEVVNAHWVSNPHEDLTPVHPWRERLRQ